MSPTLTFPDAMLSLIVLGLLPCWLAAPPPEGGSGSLRTDGDATCAAPREGHWAVAVAPDMIFRFRFLLQSPLLSSSGARPSTVSAVWPAIADRFEWMAAGTSLPILFFRGPKGSVWGSSLALLIHLIGCRCSRLSFAFACTATFNHPRACFWCV